MSKNIKCVPILKPQEKNNSFLDTLDTSGLWLVLLKDTVTVVITYTITATGNHNYITSKVNLYDRKPLCQKILHLDVAYFIAYTIEYKVIYPAIKAKNFVPNII